MEKLNTEDGQLFIKNLARFVRTHEKALANALHLRRQSSKSADLRVSQATSSSHGASSRSSAPSPLASALSLVSPRPRPAKLTLTPHHLFYLLSRFEELSIAVGPMNIRLENINAEASSASYVSFLNKPQRSKTDRDSIHSVSSARSVGSTMGAFWASFGIGSKDVDSKTEKAKAAVDTDLKYLYSSFTKIPCLKLAPDYKARLIRGYEEFPFDTAVPLHSFKNLSALEIVDIDFRSFFGWDRLAEQLRTLTIKRANVDDPAELLTRIVLDDIDRRRRRSSKSQQSPVLGAGSTSASPQPLGSSTPGRSASAPGSPMVNPSLGTSTSPQNVSASMARGGSEGGTKGHSRTTSISPTRQASPRHTGRRHTRGSTSKITRSGSGSSNSSETSAAYPNSSTSNLLTAGVLPVSKWRFLRHLSLADNSLTSIDASSLAPVASTLHSLDLSCNLFTEVPDGLASLVSLRSLNLSHCMIDSLHSLAKSPLPAITALNLRGNRLRSIAGVERLPSLERLDLRENNIPDPTEVARLTSIPDIREIWISSNPFTKSYYGYRVTIFNLFRQTPGFSEDVILDSSGPGYTEKKQLAVRIAEPKGAPVVRPPELEDVGGKEPTKQAAAAPSPSPAKEMPGKEVPAGAVGREHTVGSGRRKKNQRRRLIDLSQDGSLSVEEDQAKQGGSAKPPVKQTLFDPFVATVPEESQETRDEGGQGQGQSHHRPSTDTPSNTVHPQAKSRSDMHMPDGSTTTTTTTTTTKSSSRGLMPAIEGLDREPVGGDVYRQRLEALKQEVGANWLTVLGEDKWDNGQSGIGAHSGVSEFGPAGTIRPTSLPRTNSQAMVTGARTLG